MGARNYPSPHFFYDSIINIISLVFFKKLTGVITGKNLSIPENK